MNEFSYAKRAKNLEPLDPDNDLYNESARESVVKNFKDFLDIALRSADKRQAPVKASLKSFLGARYYEWCCLNHELFALITSEIPEEDLRMGFERSALRDLKRLIPDSAAINDETLVVYPEQPKKQPNDRRTIADTGNILRDICISASVIARDHNVKSKINIVANEDYTKITADYGPSRVVLLLDKEGKKVIGTSLGFAKKYPANLLKTKNDLIYELNCSDAAHDLACDFMPEND